MQFTPFIVIAFHSPIITALREEWETQRSALLDCTKELDYILHETQTDVYNQFTENQGKWTTLAEYTVKKKANAKSDPRILHETNVGQGERLKDAYYNSGFVENNKVFYEYPVSKPYAYQLQEGATVKSPRPKGKESKYEADQRRARNKRNKELDLDFLRAVGAPEYLAGFND